MARRSISPPGTQAPSVLHTMTRGSICGDQARARRVDFRCGRAGITAVIWRSPVHFHATVLLQLFGTSQRQKNILVPAARITCRRGLRGTAWLFNTGAFTYYTSLVVVGLLSTRSNTRFPFPVARHAYSRQAGRQAAESHLTRTTKLGRHRPIQVQHHFGEDERRPAVFDCRHARAPCTQRVRGLRPSRYAGRRVLTKVRYYSGSGGVALSSGSPSRPAANQGW